MSSLGIGVEGYGVRLGVDARAVRPEGEDGDENTVFKYGLSALKIRKPSSTPRSSRFRYTIYVVPKSFPGGFCLSNSPKVNIEAPHNKKTHARV